MIVSIEQHVDWIADCMNDLRERGAVSIEATVDAEDAWIAHVNAVADQTLFPRANSWYLGANIPGKPRVFMPYVGGVGTYAEKCRDVVAKGYEGFTVSACDAAPA
jgi:cyclohexanone monooxygenase